VPASSDAQVPRTVSNVPDDILQPDRQWPDTGAFDKALRHLASLYTANFKKYASGDGFVSPKTAKQICAAGPHLDA